MKMEALFSIDKNFLVDVNSLAKAVVACKIKNNFPPTEKITNDVIFNFWDQRTPPFDVVKRIKSWENTGLTTITYHFEEAREFLSRHFDVDLVDAFDYSHHPAMQADIFRLARLYQLGGLYVDADDYFTGVNEHELKNFPSGCVAHVLCTDKQKNQLCDANEAVIDANFESKYFYFNNSPIFSMPKHRVMELSLERVVGNVLRRKRLGERVQIHQDVGPDAFSKAVLDYATECFSGGVNFDFSISNGFQSIKLLEWADYKGTDRNWRKGASIPMTEEKAITSRTVFEEKYNKNSDWGGHSGPGSNPLYNIPYRLFIETFIHLNNIDSIVDIGCGDWQSSKYINFGKSRYTGFDVVERIVEKNNSSYKSDGVEFKIMPTDLNQIPSASLLVMKDVLQHLPDEDVFHFIKDVFPRFDCCLITNSFLKHGVHQNKNIKAGDFRTLDLTAGPYNVSGKYVLEFTSPAKEFLRTLLIINPKI